MYLRILLLFIAQDTVLVSTVIMIGEFGAARFMEIFGPTIGWRLRRLLFSPPGKQAGVGSVTWWVYKEGFDEHV